MHICIKSGCKHRISIGSAIDPDNNVAICMKCDRVCYYSEDRTRKYINIFKILISIGLLLYLAIFYFSGIKKLILKDNTNLSIPNIEDIIQGKFRSNHNGEGREIVVSNLINKDSIINFKFSKSINIGKSYDGTYYLADSVVILDGEKFQLKYLDQNFHFVAVRDSTLKYRKIK